MKHILVTAILILAGAPVTGFAASAVDEGKAIEAKMDDLKPDLRDAKTAAAQDNLAVESAQFVKKYLKKSSDAPTFEAACRILVRGYEYDRDDTIGNFANDQIVNNGDRIDKVFLKFEAEKQFDRSDLEKIRPNYRMPKRNKASNGNPKLAPAIKAKPATAAKPEANSHSEDGASLPKCLQGKCKESHLLQTIAAALGMGQKANEELTFSSYDPSPKKR